jgi:hypothetical protein
VGTTSPNGGTVQIQSTSPDNHLYISSVAPDIVFGNNTTRTSATAIGYVGLATSANHFATGSAAGDLLVGTSQSNKLHFVTNGSIRATVDGSGNVGVGTTSPAAKLAFGTSLGTGAKIHLFDDTATNRYGLGIQAGEMQLFVPAAGHFSFNAGGDVQASGTNELMRITGGGNVGIGTTAPSVKLDIRGSGVNSGGKLAIVNSDATNAIGFYSGQNNDARAGIYWTSNTPLVLGTQTSGSVDGTGFAELVRITSGGNVGLGMTPDSSYKLDVNGSVRVSGNISAKFQDVAEWVPATHALAAGTVVILNPTKSNEVMASITAYDTRVAGVVSERPGLALGEAGTDKVLVATTGRVKIKVDATKAPIHVGDLLVTSDMEGVAMKSEPVDLGGVKIHRPGTLIGKALEPLGSGKGEILVLLSLQ